MVVDALEGFGRREAALAPVLGEAIGDPALELDDLRVLAAAVSLPAPCASAIPIVERNWLRCSNSAASFASTKPVTSSR